MPRHHHGTRTTRIKGDLLRQLLLIEGDIAGLQYDLESDTLTVVSYELPGEETNWDHTVFSGFATLDALRGSFENSLGKQLSADTDNVFDWLSGLYSQVNQPTQPADSTEDAPVASTPVPSTPVETE